MYLPGCEYFSSFTLTSPLGGAGHYNLINKFSISYFKDYLIYISLYCVYNEMLLRTVNVFKNFFEVIVKWVSGEKANSFWKIELSSC